jgi:hypothetical protein
LGVRYIVNFLPYRLNSSYFNSTSPPPPNKNTVATSLTAVQLSRIRKRGKEAVEPGEAREILMKIIEKLLLSELNKKHQVFQLKVRSYIKT